MPNLSHCLQWNKILDTCALFMLDCENLNQQDLHRYRRCQGKVEKDLAIPRSIQTFSCCGRFLSAGIHVLHSCIL